jgi:ribokinase
MTVEFVPSTSAPPVLPVTPRVVVVGSFNQDLAWNCEHLPRPGETLLGRFRSGPGGKGSNQAIAAGRAGAPTRFIGAVGADGFAAEARRFYRAEGIATHFVTIRGQPTGTAAILVDEQGQNAIAVALGANNHLRPRDLTPARLRGAQVVVCQHEVNLAVNARAFVVAHEVGALAVLNPAPMRADFDPGILAATDVLIPNETEFIALVHQLPACAALLRRAPFRGRGPVTEESLARLKPAVFHLLCRAFRVPTVIVTLGRRGCFVSEVGRHTLIPACRGIVAVNTSGAGDAFVGGFAAGLVRFKGDTLAAARYGTVVAGLSVTRAGTAPSMPRLREIARFRRKGA